MIDSRPKVIKARCPAVVPGTSDAVDDYPDLVIWHATSYIRQDSIQLKPKSALPQPIQLDFKITTIACSLADPTSTNGLHIANGQWPDRTATGLPEGTPIYTVRDVDPSCATAKAHQKTLVYLAANLDGSPHC